MGVQARSDALRQTDALTLPPDWPHFHVPRFDWLGAPSCKHLLENLPRSLTQSTKTEYENSLKVSAAAEVGFFLILLLYALTGLTYNFKKMDEFMCVIWIAYFLFSFRPVIKI